FDGCAPRHASISRRLSRYVICANAITRNCSLQRNFRTRRSPPYPATIRSKLLHGTKFITCANSVRPAFTVKPPDPNKRENYSQIVKPIFKSTPSKIARNLLAYNRNSPQSKVHRSVALNRTAVIRHGILACLYLEPSLHHHALYLCNGSGGIEALRAGLCTVHYRMTTIKTKWIFDVVQTLAGHFITAIGEPAISMQKRGGAQIAVAIPPIAWTRGGATRTQYALVKSVEFLAILPTLPPFTLRLGSKRLQPWFDRSILRIKVCQIRHQILYHIQMRQRINRYISSNLFNALG